MAARFPTDLFSDTAQPQRNLRSLRDTYGPAFVSRRLLIYPRYWLEREIEPRRLAYTLVLLFPFTPNYWTDPASSYLNH